MRRPFTWTGLFCLALGCGQASAPTGAPPIIEEETDPIIGGKTDTGDPSVVALYGQPPGSSEGFLCTATVIAPTVVLTAAHCVSPLEAAPGTRYVVVAGPDISQPDAPQLAVRAVHANPRWSPKNLQAGHDEGIIILGQPTSLRPLPFLRQSLTSSLVGKPLRIVGYGLDDGSLQTGAGTKRQALTTLRSISANLIRVGDSRRGTCNGDSGGPAFMNLAGVETLVGTTSYGNADCSDGGFDARVDVDLDFIEQYLPPTCTPACDGRSCGPDGCGGSCGACGDGGSCSSDGLCVAATGGCDGGSSEQEPNDSALQANPLCAGGTSGGTFSSANDQDWFSWTVDPGATYTVTLSGTGDMAVRVYKLAATGRLSFIGDGPTVARHTDMGGSYVGRVTTTATTRARYTLDVQNTP